ncbi:MAG: beta-N-acetylhexosaminidase [Aestuariibaculum sp.]
MKKYFLLLLMLGILASCNKYADVVNTEADYQIIPKPTSLEIVKGRFLVNTKTKIGYGEGLQLEANYLAEMLNLATGLNITSEVGAVGNIVLILDEAIENEEGYKLNITAKTIEITAKTGKGIFYGVQTLRQLLPAEAEAGKVTSNLTIPAVKIEDSPRYIYRGSHLDVARHFFPVSFIKKYIDLLALHKMNRFHWHLTEDQGWRIEIKKYPKLTEIGAYRNGTIIGHYPGESESDNERYGGFYTQEDVKEVVKYAADSHIVVIPEIEMPGHGSAAIASYPYLSCFPDEPTVLKGNGAMSNKSKELQANGTPKVVYETWGVTDDVFCAGKETTFTFLQDVLEEVIPLFPSKYIHIGGDECPKKNWERCSGCQKKIKENNLEDEHGLQSYFINRIEKFVNSKGKQIIGWDEILEGGLAPNATVMSWRGSKGGIESAKQKHDVIMAPNTHCYLDYYQSDDKENEPLAIGGFLPVEKVYSLDPTPDVLTADEQKYILGPQGNVWTEYIVTTDHLEYMVFPRLTAISEVGWSSKSQRDYNDFVKRLKHLSKRYDALNVNYAKHVLKD